MVVERFTPRPLWLEGMPPLMVDERVSLDCDCTVFIGMRCDRFPVEPTTLASPCASEHLHIVEHFSLLLRESLVAPQNRPLVDVVEDLLGQAEKYAGVPS